jgi:peptidyl-prolyl cis-trans isomerase SurA
MQLKTLPARPRRCPALTAAAAACAWMLAFTAGAETLDRILAIVDEEVIMASEFERYRDRIAEQLTQQETQLPPASIFDKQVLDRLVMQKLQIQFARRTGVTVDDETLNKAITGIAAQNKISLAQFRETLERDGYSYDSFREEIRGELTVARLRQREVDNRIVVTDREIDNYLANQLGQVGENEYHLSHILIATTDGASPEAIELAREKAQQTLDELRAGGDFRKIAVAVSEDQQALAGGDLGWRKEGQIPTLFVDRVKAMGKGEVSDLIRSPSGFHIIRVNDARTQEAHLITQTHARHILIKPSELVSSKDAKVKLEQIKLRIEGGDDFAELARSFSDDRGSAAKGGDLGWASPGDMVPDFENVMNELQPNGISDPFESPFGWHLVQVLERREHDDTEEAKRARARETIRGRKIEEETQNWLRRLRDEAYVEYRTGEEEDAAAADDSG